MEKTERVKGRLMYQRKGEEKGWKVNMKHRKLIRSKTAKFDQRGNEKTKKEMEKKTETSKGKLMYQRKREKGGGKANKEYRKWIWSKIIKSDQKGNEKNIKELEERTENFTQTKIYQRKREEGE